MVLPVIWAIDFSRVGAVPRETWTVKLYHIYSNDEYIWYIIVYIKRNYAIYWAIFPSGGPDSVSFGYFLLFLAPRR